MYCAVLNQSVQPVGQSLYWVATKSWESGYVRRLRIAWQAGATGLATYSTLDNSLQVLFNGLMLFAARQPRFGPSGLRRSASGAPSHVFRNDGGRLSFRC
jgi:hypothetical protein